MRNLLITGMLIFLFHFSVKGQLNQYRFSRIDISQGLSNNEVNCIFRDETGFIWFGTRSGLDCYDGYSFKIFKHDLRDSNSITDEEIDQIFQGPDHKLWINTKSGLVTYDLLTEKFDHHPQTFLKNIGIPDNALLDLRKDKSGNFWFLGAGTGLYKYLPETGKAIHFLSNVGDDASAASTIVTGFALSDSGFIWSVTNTGFLMKTDASTGQVIAATDALQQMTSGASVSYSLYFDVDGDLWVYSPGKPNGVYYYDVLRQKLAHFSKTNSVCRLNNDFVRIVVQDDEGRIWLATDHGGINVIDKKDFSVKYLLNYEGDNYSLAQNSVNSMYKDKSGIIWVGTFKKGVCYYNKHIIKFPLYRHRPSDPEGLSYNDINRFAEDEKGNIWIGTNGGGLVYFNRKSGKFTKYTHDPNNNNSLCNDVVVSLCIDHDRTLWIGTYFGGLDHFDGKKFTHYRHNDADNNSIADNAIWSIMEDSLHRLWIGTFSSGLDIYDRHTNKFTHFRGVGYHSVHSSYVCDLIQAKNGDIWIATSNGIDVFEKKTNAFSKYYYHNPANPTTSLSNDNTIALLQDSRGLIWVATREGLDYFDTATHKFTTLRKEDGLPDNIILSVVEDKQHELWAGTPNGLSNIIISKNEVTGKLSFQFRNYNQSDGLQGKEFNEYAACATREGELLFGGSNGFNLFTPRQINPVSETPKLVLTDLQVFNKSVNIGEKLDGHVILPQSISATKEITLKYNENIFSIDFADLNFLNNAKLKYAYTLTGFNNEWFVADDKTHKAVYTNLDPGTYEFKVAGIDENGKLGPTQAYLKINILPPLWRTPWAYALYVVLLIIVLYIARKIMLQRAKMRFAIEEERREAQRLHELDMMKIRFFTNMSHELKTPLSLILTPLDKIIKNAREPLQKRQFKMIHRNAKRLLNLVNQLLDFRKLETQELKLCPQKGDIINFIKEVSYSFNDLAAKKHIVFSFNSSVDHFFTEFDHDKIERIMFNLLSNAFKFTPGNGSVTVDLNARSEKENSILEIKVCDSGIGIPADKQEKIFNRFFQNDLPDNMINEGSGIGLSITREFVRLHNGIITVESEVNKGTSFTLTMPLRSLTREVSEIDDEDEYIDFTGNAEDVGLAGENRPPHAERAHGPARKKTVLLVEDHDDLRMYLKENLGQYYNIVEANNGKLGWQKTLSAHPDIIITDISMPDMNGIDLCRKIKNDKRTSFLPVILLTALTGEEQELKGLETGASDYVTKPFNFEILLSKIRNLLAQQESAKKAYQKLVKSSPAEIHLESPDEKFMHRAMEIVEKNISNPGFLIENLYRELYISRVGLYKKMLALTGKSPLEFVRWVRLQRAAQLLEKSNMTVSEVAYEVGFNDPKYFSRFFKAHFNMLPSAFRVQKQNENGISANSSQS